MQNSLVLLYKRGIFTASFAIRSLMLETRPKVSTSPIVEIDIFKNFCQLGVLMSDVVPIPKCPSCGRYDTVKPLKSYDGRYYTNKYTCSECKNTFGREAYPACTASTLNATTTSTSGKPKFFTFEA